MKILMVCLGNICRSPMADGLLRRKVKDLGLSIEVDSAGTSGHHNGEAPDHRMSKLAALKNTPIDFLRSRKFTKADFKNFDLIYVMDQSNYKNVCALSSNKVDLDKVKYILNEIHTDSNAEVPDPYYGGADGFNNVYNLLDQATDNIIQKINTNTLL